LGGRDHHAMPSDHPGLGPFLSQVRTRVDGFDADELRALLLAHAESLEPAARAPFSVDPHAHNLPRPTPKPSQPSTNRRPRQRSSRKRIVVGARDGGGTVSLRIVKRGSPPARYRCPVNSQRVPGGVVHKLPADLREALIANTTALDAWKDITPLARNEFICWVEDAKQETTRERRIRRTQEELENGQRRPCCWPGCKHRDRSSR